MDTLAKNSSTECSAGKCVENPGSTAPATIAREVVYDDTAVCSYSSYFAAVGELAGYYYLAEVLPAL